MEHPVIQSMKVSTGDIDAVIRGPSPNDRVEGREDVREIAALAVCCHSSRSFALMCRTDALLGLISSLYPVLVFVTRVDA